VDADAQALWQEVLDRRTREMAEGRVDSRPEEEMIWDIRAKLDARHPTS
jgi:hypothetical protein